MIYDSEPSTITPGPAVEADEGVGTEVVGRGGRSSRKRKYASLPDSFGQCDCGETVVEEDRVTNGICCSYEGCETQWV